jgi:hypothetical protein
VELTQWFDPDEKPTLTGWYDTRWFAGDRFTENRLWWRKGWRLDSRSPLLPNQHRPWLGLRPTDAELERRTGEPHIDGYPLQSGLPPAKEILKP